MTSADWRAEIERLADLRDRLSEQLKRALDHDARWLAERDFTATQIRLAYARDQLAASCAEGCP